MRGAHVRSNRSGSAGHAGVYRVKAAESRAEAVSPKPVSRPPAAPTPEAWRLVRALKKRQTRV